jgi:DNA-directed RNA polymerase specialized sigma24 family protein
VRGENGKYRGRNYADVGFVLGLTENAVKKRISKLRDRLKREKKDEKNKLQKSREEAEAERRNGFSIGLAKLRAGKP